jgi:hypothetical protein
VIRLVKLSEQAMELIESQKTLPVLYRTHAVEPATLAPARVAAAVPLRIGAAS